MKENNIGGFGGIDKIFDNMVKSECDINNIEERFDWILEEAEKNYNQNINWRDFADLFLGCDSKYMPKKRKEQKLYFKSDVFRKIMFMKFDLESIQRD